MSNSNSDRFLFGQLNSNYLNPYDWIELENVKSSYQDTNIGANNFPFRTGGIVLTEEEKEEKDNNLEIIDSVYSTINQYLKIFDKKVLKSDEKNFSNMDHKTLSGMMENFRTNIDQLLRLLKGNRYPLLALIGRRGCGKSSCINAIVGQLIAEPGHIRAQTGHAKILLYRGNDNSGIDVLDTRGINEGERPEEDDIAETAVDSIVSALSQVPVDCILYLHKAKELDSGIESDLQILNQIIVKTNLKSIKIPIIGVITHCDELEPSDIKKPSEYDEEKLENIELAKNFFKNQLDKYAPDLKDCIVGVEAISSSVIWNKIPDENGAILPKRDYRYNIDKIMDLLMNNINMQAMFKTAQVCRVQLIKTNFANMLIKLFASVTAVVSTLPVPTADSVPLSALEIWMVYTIAKLGNNKLSWDSTKKFLGMLGVSGIARYCARKVISSFSKLFPIVGYGTSAAITYSITLGLGKSAIAFFLENKSDEEVKEIFNAAKLAIDEYNYLSTEERVEFDKQFVEGMKEVSRRDDNTSSKK
ncbi:hypothetical protein BCR36DRAFT_320835 [Piromyces finnis]|uniref:G domain-containing protein n=1 Tax=Piromyces finnis TaxID=1754191 RepID=A0A1Y1VH41_9FUNG|nr:hypothetical protein BCR36DRAFT_320835 [Piromyces finnis]|eukprot:ORX56038.1 hypothetical protein BCR36DRAFT_320835 [Piromyces finnis]